ncbi:sulfotransferase 1A1-like [Diadema setosum]|uniref:sulfotransferase 1A1-like n=1 Tax=Diadema setosum TaxID=31175 RepID=UPI003B3B8911
MAANPDAPYLQLQHCHDGIWYTNFCLDSSIDNAKNFEVRPDDVFIITYPKSGTHWMMEIMGLILSDGYIEKVDRSLLTSALEMINMDQAFPKSKEEEAQNPVDMSPFMEILDKAPSPRMVISHLRKDRFPKDLLQKAKVIYIARNPKDVVTSWYNFLGKSPFLTFTWEENFKAFLDGKSPWGPWPEHVKEFWEAHEDPNLLFLFYEDMLKDPLGHIRQVANHVGRPLSEEALQRVVANSSIKQMKKTYEGVAEKKKEGNMLVELKFLAKGVSGRWKNFFTVAQNEEFDDWYAKQMSGTDIPVTFE